MIQFDIHEKQPLEPVKDYPQIIGYFPLLRPPLRRDHCQNKNHNGDNYKFIGNFRIKFLTQVKLDYPHQFVKDSGQKEGKNRTGECVSSGTVNR